MLSDMAHLTPRKAAERLNEVKKHTFFQFWLDIHYLLLLLLFLLLFFLFCVFLFRVFFFFLLFLTRGLPPVLFLLFLTITILTLLYVFVFGFFFLFGGRCLGVDVGEGQGSVEVGEQVCESHICGSWCRIEVE